MELWAVRHAETAWTLARRHTGRTDIPLTDAGREHARRLRERLAGHDFALVLSSPLSRAWESAELTGFGDRAQPREDLLEWDYGEYEGLTTAEIRAMRPGWDLWRDGCPGGETAEAAGERVDRVIDEALRAGGDVLCFAHSHVLRVLGARWIEQSPRLGGRIVLDTAAISRLGFERETRVLRAWNLV